MNIVRQLLRTRPRLLISIGIGAACGALWPLQWSAVTRVLIAWNVTVWSYLLLVAWLMQGSTHVQVRRTAA